MDGMRRLGLRPGDVAVVRRRARLNATVLVCIALFMHCAALEAATTERVSVSSMGAEGNSSSVTPAISGDGRIVVFASNATNLVSGDSNGVGDIFAHDRQTGQTTLISLGMGGGVADGESLEPAVSADGRYVVFLSDATNLVPDDTNGVRDVFVHDRTTGQTTRASVDSAGAQAEAASASAVISADGRFVGFSSAASNLVAGDTNGESDVFLYDRQSGQTERVSVGVSGTEPDGPSEAPAISADGRYVAFQSAASNLAEGDAIATLDIFVRDRNTAQTALVSMSSTGNPGDGASIRPAISADGMIVAFRSFAANLVNDDDNRTQDIFVHDRQSGQTNRVSKDSRGVEGNDESFDLALSADGQYVAFMSRASNLVPADTNDAVDAFVHERASDLTVRVSVGEDGAEAEFGADRVAISGNGRQLAFASFTRDLVSDDSNGVFDVFVRGPQLPGLSLASTLSGAPSDAVFFGGATAGDGMTFRSVFGRPDRIDVLVDVSVDPDDVGSQGALYVVALYEGFLFFKNASGGFTPWDGNVGSLVPTNGPRMLLPLERVEVVRGLSGISGNFAVIVGYEDATGDVHFHPALVVFSVAAE